MLLRILVWLWLCWSVNALAMDARFAERSLRIGFDVEALPDISRSDLEVSLKFWASEISSQANIPISVTFYDDQTQQLVSDFENGIVNYVFTSPIKFAKHFKREHLADGFISIQTGKRLDNLLLLTQRNAHIDGVSQLRQRNITLLAKDELQEIYLSLLSLQTFGQDYPQNFRVTPPEINSHRLILQAFFKKTDAVLVSEAAFDLAKELNPEIGRVLQVIAKLVNVPRSVGYFHQAVQEDFREEVIAKALKLQDYQRGQQIIEVFKGDKVDRTEVGDLENVAKLYQEYQQLKRQSGRP